jgi:arabinofuranosyltransferase
MAAATGDWDGRLRAALLAAAALCLAWLWLFLSFTADDSFITFRYGRTLTEHGVWNWNASGPRAEAYTSGLYALLSIVPAALGLAPAPIFKLLGIAAFILMLQRLWRYGGVTGLVYGAAVAACTPYLFVHVASGLETPVFVLLMMEIAARLLSGAAVLRQGQFYVLLMLLPFVRPEGALFSAVAALLLAKQIGWRRLHWRWLGIAVGCGAIYFVGRWIYFGQMLPTPFYAKTGFNPADLIANLLSFRLYLAVAVALLVLVRNSAFRLLLLAQLAIVLLLYTPAYLQMNFADRFALQALLPLILVAPLAIASDSAAGASAGGRWQLIAMGAMALMAGIGNLSQSHVTWLIGYTSAATQTHRALGLALAPLRPHGYTIAMADSGLIAYHAGWRAIDLVGLADSEVARRGNSLAYMEQARPDIIVLYSTSERAADMRTHGLGHEAAAEFLQRHRQWQQAASLPWNDSYWLVVFRRGDLPDRARLDQSLQRIEADARAWNEHRLRTRLWRALSLQDAFL